MRVLCVFVRRIAANVYVMCDALCVRLKLVIFIFIVVLLANSCDCECESEFEI
jgi:hypothetical protein